MLSRGLKVQAPRFRPSTAIPDPDEPLLLPSQHLPPVFTTPYRRLFAAVLEMAAHDVRHYAGTASAEGQALHAAAVRWFASDEEDWPCSFRSICDVLGIAPDAARRTLGNGRLKPGTNPRAA